MMRKLRAWVEGKDHSQDHFPYRSSLNKAMVLLVSVAVICTLYLILADSLAHFSPRDKRRARHDVLAALFCRTVTVYSPDNHAMSCEQTIHPSIKEINKYSTRHAHVAAATDRYLATAALSTEVLKKLPLVRSITCAEVSIEYSSSGSKDIHAYLLVH